MKLDPSSELARRADEIRDAAKPVETFWLDRDPLTGLPIEPTYRRAIPVYDAETLELREFLP